MKQKESNSSQARL